MLPSDPPQYSSASAPFVALPKDDAENDALWLPSKEWAWQDEWHIDQSVPDADGEGFTYSLSHHPTTAAAGFSSFEIGDCVRRRCWARTRERRTPMQQASTARRRVDSSDDDGADDSDDGGEVATTASAAAGSAEGVLGLLRSFSRRVPATPSNQVARVSEIQPSIEPPNATSSVDARPPGTQQPPASLSAAERRVLSPVEVLTPAERVEAIRRKLEPLTNPQGPEPTRAQERRITQLRKALAKAEDEALDADVPAYLRNRHPERTCELERELDSPFQTLQISSGQADTPVAVATLKMLARLVEAGATLPSRDQQLLSAIMTPREFVVRVYVLAGQKLAHRGEE